MTGQRIGADWGEGMIYDALATDYGESTAEAVAELLGDRIRGLLETEQLCKRYMDEILDVRSRLTLLVTFCDQILRGADRHSRAYELACEAIGYEPSLSPDAHP